METKVCVGCGTEFVGGLKGQELCDNCEREDLEGEATSNFYSECI